MTSWPFVNLSQSVWGELDLLLEAATLHYILGACLAWGEKKHPGLCGHFAVHTSPWQKFKKRWKGTDLWRTPIMLKRLIVGVWATSICEQCLCRMTDFLIFFLFWYLISPEKALDLAWFISENLMIPLCWTLCLTMFYQHYPSYPTCIINLHTKAPKVSFWRKGQILHTKYNEEKKKEWENKTGMIWFMELTIINQISCSLWTLWEFYDAAFWHV